MGYKIGEVLKDIKTGEKFEVIGFDKATGKDLTRVVLKNVVSGSIKELNGYIGEFKSN